MLQVFAWHRLTIAEYCSLHVTISDSAAYRWFSSWAGSGFATCGFISHSVGNMFYRFLILAPVDHLTSKQIMKAAAFPAVMTNTLNTFLRKEVCLVLAYCPCGGFQSNVCVNFFKLKRTRVRRHNQQQPVTRRSGQRARYCTHHNLEKCQLAFWQPSGQFPSVTVNQWLQTWLLRVSYVLCFHFPFLTNFR